MKEEEKDMVSKTALKPSKSLSAKLKKDAVRLSVKDEKIELDRMNPVHRMLMDDDNDETKL